MGGLSPWHLLIVAAVFVVLFGAKKLPDASRSLGQSLRIFKAETRGLRDDPDTDEPTRTSTTTRTLPAAPLSSNEAPPVVTEHSNPR